MSLTTEQLEARLGYITGSDAAVICGVSPWGNIIDLWRYKCRLAQAPDISQSPFVKAGNYLEPAIRKWFVDETGKEVILEPNLIVHKDIDFLAGNIDGRLTNESAILEIKTTSRPDGWGDDGENIIPFHYLCQISHYMAVCDVDRSYVAVLIGGNDFRIYTIERNKRLEIVLIQKELEFWECVKTETPPEPRTGEEVLSLYGAETLPAPLIADGHIQELLEGLRECKRNIAVYEEKSTHLEDCIKVYMGKNDSLLDLAGMPAISWKSAKGAMRFDSKKFSEENQALYEKYLKQSNPTRRFLIK